MNTAELKELTWERIYLCMTLFVSAEGEIGGREDAPRFYITDQKGCVCGRPQHVSRDGECWQLRFNITDRGDGRMLQEGSYALALCDSADALLCYAECSLSEEIKRGADRRFSYQSDKCYKVHFSDGKLFFHIAHYKGGLPGRIGSGVKYALLQAYYDLCHVLRSRGDKTTVLFLSQLSDTSGQNLRAVMNRLQERMLEGAQEKYVLTEYAGDSRKAGGSKQLLTAVRKLAQSSVVLMDDHVPFLDRITPSKDTTLIQLWHGGVGFKATGYSRFGHKGSVGPVSAHRKYTWGVTASKKTVPIFSELWGIPDERVIDCGIPRMDSLLDEERAAEIRKRLQETYPMCKGRKVILFAPTYRGKDRRDATYPLDKIDFAKWYERAQAEDYIVLIRLHPWITYRGFVPERFRDRIVETDPGDSINELFLLTDLLITDYSSAVFEFAPLLRPMLFYVFDREEYESGRGFHHDFDANAPGEAVTDFDSLLDAISADTGESDRVKEYVERYFDPERMDGKACDRIIDWLIDGKLPGEYKKALAFYKKEVRVWRRLTFSSLP